MTVVGEGDTLLMMGIRHKGRSLVPTKYTTRILTLLVSLLVVIVIFVGTKKSKGICDFPSQNLTYS